MRPARRRMARRIRSRRIARGGAFAGRDGLDCGDRTGCHRVSPSVCEALTLERPSCYYEVGLAQALNRRVQAFAERGTQNHQAHDRDRAILYGSLEDLAELLR